MNSELPIDFSNPVIRDYMSLVRLQVLTPLSLLINITITLICSLVLHPSLGDVTRLHPASISPSVPAIAAYIFMIYLGQVGYCILLVAARRPETKSTIVKGVGLALVFANWVMAGSAIAWVFEAFLKSTIFLGILTLLLIYSNVVLIVYHAPTWTRPLDVVFIHAPVRLFLILALSLLFPYSLFVTLGHAWDPAYPGHYERKQWGGFAYVLAVNLAGLFIIALCHDWVWCLGATWMCVSIWMKEPKPLSIYIIVIIFTVLHPVTLIVVTITKRLTRKRQEGHIRLPSDEEITHQERATSRHEVQADWS
ncbi:hypothetical protein B0F90DRAFT_1631259 [Multifurca ochricompacta]|uniref:Uncharacterized protein n=1 Tax=Multifurca ochricompacta TaxID=376703 RepID=A0AAD4QLK9_9AGAM|nr:hypothetical protein B0F90DRAFT_1631259 [Multifurca ochricompacta]